MQGESLSDGRHGAQAVRALHLVGKYGARTLQHRQIHGFANLLRQFREQRARDLIELHLDDQPFRVSVERGGLSVRRGTAPDADDSRPGISAARAQLLMPSHQTMV